MLNRPLSNDKTKYIGLIKAYLLLRQERNEILHTRGCYGYWLLPFGNVTNLYRELQVISDRNFFGIIVTNICIIVSVIKLNLTAACIILCVSM